MEEKEEIGRQRLKERPRGGKKTADSVWEAHYGCHLERLVADNRTSSPIVHHRDTIFKYAFESPSLTPAGIPEIPTVFPSF